MMMKICFGMLCLVTLGLTSCKKGGSPDPTPPTHPFFNLTTSTINGKATNTTNFGIGTPAAIKFTFSSALDPASTATAVSFVTGTNSTVAFSTSLENNNTTLVVQANAPLNPVSKYAISVATSLKSSDNGTLQTAVSLKFTTAIDSSDKFSTISDDSLLTLVQRQTFKYFWDFADPTSGLAKERNADQTITTGGSGFGIMAIPVAINRSFITKADGLARMQKIVGFLKNTAQRFHGAYSHWLNGTTGAVIPFADNDDGGDIVETSYLMMGLLTARQYFNGANTSEADLRSDINDIWNGVEWDWYRQNSQEVLYWNWSPNYNWAINVAVQGWNETLITYVMAASSTTHGIPKTVYDQGFARNGGMENGKSFYGITLPLGEDYGGPLFFEHYSFQGINPNGLSDAYANYQQQTLNHTQINYEFCKANPNNYYGYSDQCWGLTASDVEDGYDASSPTNDNGTIAPTAALSSMPYTPAASIQALKFFYYKLGDKLWGEYGFKDAFDLSDGWFADSYLAIDEGPIITMIENYRTGLIWNLFTSCPEVKAGMQSLGFSAPYL